MAIFCLGLINVRAKSDAVAARRDFRNFIERSDGRRFPVQIEAARRWIAEIDALLVTDQAE